MIIAPLFLLAFGLGFAGMILLVRGMRGVPSLSEPRCAKCGYDLRGSAGAPAGVCPECGADLTKPRAVRWGDYRKRPKLIWTGAALLDSTAPEEWHRLVVVVVVVVVVRRPELALPAPLEEAPARA